MTRIVAANRVIDADGDEMKPGVVELEGKYVSCVYPLFGERPFTEWLGGTINIKRSADGRLQAYKDGEVIIDNQ
ncbi:hypothetical protein [Prevotella sp.]|uniref:hypothetical protein n=1 Tax=Prevotella sp. TaxID=59823 RepID=UPI0025CF0E4B|nr:hypothetical protein [Prevotella sp.]